MSVQVNQYIGFGFMLDYSAANKALNNKHGEDKAEELLEDYYDSAFEKDIVEVNGCSIIVDGMNGEFMFVGKLYAKSPNYVFLNSMQIPKVKPNVKKVVQERLVELFGDAFDVKPEMNLITVYR